MKQSPSLSFGTVVSIGVAIIVTTIVYFSLLRPLTRTGRPETRATLTSALAAKDIREAVYLSSYWNPCPTWRDIYLNREGSYFHRRECLGDANLSRPERPITEEEFSHAVLVNSLGARQVEASVVLGDAAIDRTGVACYQSNDRVDAVCANSLGIIVFARSQPSLRGMLDADSSRTIESYKLIE